MPEENKNNNAEENIEKTKNNNSNKNANKNSSKKAIWISTIIVVILASVFGYILYKRNSIHIFFVKLVHI